MRRGPSRVKQRVPLAAAKLAALMYLNKHWPDRLAGAADVAHAIWPDATFKAQGAGGAASRILKLLQKDGHARWTSHGRESWGWEITGRGRREAFRQTS